ncbi:MAG: hypothetical protein ABSE81_04845 [Candidatus Omnitrophota bacterium]
MKERIHYLAKVLDNFRSYKFSEIDIVIDTNSSETEKKLPSEFICGLKIRIQVHENLKHPWLLTWQHRGNMLQNIKNYDFFMYIEDDILVQWDAIVRWYKDTLIIYPQGYIRGFLRVEKSPKGVIMSSDFGKKAYTPIFKTIENLKWFLTPAPYHAFWIYTKKQMLEFINHPAWTDGNHPEWKIRERASAGMIWKHPHEHRVLLPVDSGNKIPPDAWCYHLPNNFALDKNQFGGKIPVTRIISNRTVLFLERVFFIRRIKKIIRRFNLS